MPSIYLVLISFLICTSTLALSVRAESSPIEKSLSRTKKLEQYKVQAKRISDKIAKTRLEMDKETAKLADYDLRISKLEKDHKLLSDNKLSIEQKLLSLKSRRQSAERQSSILKKQLLALLKTGIISKHKSTLGILLSDSSEGDLPLRQAAYHEYLVVSQSKKIAQLKQTEQQLIALSKTISENKSERLLKEKALQKNLSQLKTQRAQRKKHTASLTKKFSQEKRELNRTNKDILRLKNLLAEIKRNTEQVTITETTRFTELKGQLPYPLNRQHISGQFFNSNRTNLLLEAHKGAPVRTIADGHVVYADWLKGFGLILIIDHGENFMSLYGHNEALLREPGDWVAAGEIIAKVGISGGLNKSQLYFEIRHKGKPQSLTNWLNKQNNSKS